MTRKLFITALFVSASFLTTRAQYTGLLDFDSTNGSLPVGDLISDGTLLYGMTPGGGTNDIGTIFKIKPDGTGYGKLLDFTGPANGRQPSGSLISDDTFFYGMTGWGGTDDYGVIFKIRPDGTGFTKLHDFSHTDGRSPHGSLIAVDSFLYGMTSGGGTYDSGVIFKIKPDGTGYVKLLDFNSAVNGSYPQGSLISDGTFLYGMTVYGGTNNKGVIFKIKLDGAGFAKLLDFDGAANGSEPQGSLISDGTFLYGMTRTGGPNSVGDIFRIKPDGTGYSKLYDFDSVSDGRTPEGSLIFNGNFLYGMTPNGGIVDCFFGCGILFRINPDGTGYVNLLDFSYTNGYYPYGALISDGTFLYGMTQQGGTNGLGVIFKYQDSTATGIAGHPWKDGFNVYPNPGSGEFTIEMEGSRGAKGDLLITDILGQVVHQQTLNTKLETLNLNVPGGIYFIHIQTEQGTASKKIVVSQ